MDPTSNKKYPRKKILGIVLLILAVLLLTINFLFLWLVQPLFEKKIQKIVQEESQGLYSIRFNASQSQILIGNIVLDSVTLLPLTKPLDSLKKLGLEPCRLYEVKIKRVSFYISNLPQALLTGKFYIGFFTLESPSITIHLAQNHCLNEKNHPISPKPSRLTLSSSNRLKSILIEKFLSTGGKLQVQTQTPNGTITAFQSSGITLNADSLIWNPVYKEKLSPLNLLKNTRFSMILHDSQWQSASKDYQVMAKRIFYSNREGIMEIQDATGGKQGNPVRFLQTPDSLPPGINFSIHYASLNQFNWPALLLGESFIVGNIGLQGGDVWVVEGKSPNIIPLRRPLPKGWLEKIHIPVAVNNLSFNQINVSYLERNIITGKSGFLEFYHSGGSVKNIHNGIHTQYESDWTDLNVNSEPYQKGKMNCHIRFNIQDPAQSFTLDSRIQDLPLNTLNSLSVPISGIKIIGGNLSSLQFSMKGDTLQSSGTVHATYKNLRLKFLTNLNEQNPKKIRMMSALANTFLILNDNPLMGEKERYADFTYKRDPYRSFFFYIWKSLFTGLRPILGIGPQREKSIFSFIKELREYQKWDQTNQNERAQNKLMRKKKRMLRRLKHQIPGMMITPY